MIPTVIDENSLSQMTYAELRKIAKTYGVKANMKAEKLQKAILEKVTDCGKAPQKEMTNPGVKEKPDPKQSEVAVSNPRKRRIRRDTYNVDDEDKEDKVEANDVVAKVFVVPKKPRRSSSPKQKVKKANSSIPRPRRRNAPPPSMRSHTPIKSSASQLGMKKPAVKSLIRSHTPSKNSSAHQNGNTPLAKPLLKRSHTPNFARIHEKAFSKMDSLHSFVQRKQQRSAMLLKSPLPIAAVQGVQKENVNLAVASKIPKFVLPAKPLDFAFGKNSVEEKVFQFSGSLIPRLVLHPTTFTFGTSLQREEIVKFSAKPSADKVAKVKPRTMKLVSENPKNLHSKDFSVHKMRKENEKKEIIKGVRTNRRFELQMKNRVLSK